MDDTTALSVLNKVREKKALFSTFKYVGNQLDNLADSGMKEVEKWPDDAGHFLTRKWEKYSPTAEAHPLKTTVDNMMQTDLVNSAVKDVGRLGLLTLGAGITARGLAGIYALMRKPKSRKRIGPAVLPLPVVKKSADQVFQNANKLVKSAAITRRASLPWYGPAMLLTGVGGLYAGWKGLDSILDARRKKEREEELDKAKTYFHDTLIDQYRQPVLKQSSDSFDANAALAEVFTQTKNFAEKLASWWGTSQDVSGNLLGGAAGLYATYAAGTGGLALLLARNAQLKRNKRKVVQDALEERERQLFQNTPTEVYAVPEPVSLK